MHLRVLQTDEWKVLEKVLLKATKMGSRKNSRKDLQNVKLKE